MVNYLGYNASRYHDDNVNIKLHEFQRTCGTIKKTNINNCNVQLLKVDICPLRTTGDV